MSKKTLNIYTNIPYIKKSRPGEKIIHTSMDAIYKALKSSKYLYIDTETSAKNFNRQALIDEYIISHEKSGGKITKTTYKTAANYAESVRTDKCLNPYESNVALLQCLTDAEDIYIIDCSIIQFRYYLTLMRAISKKLLIGQNLKFDIKVLTVTSCWPEEPLKDPAFNLGEIWDTWIGFKLVRTPNVIGFVSSKLGDIVKYHTGVELAKDQGASDWSGTITPEMFYYAIDDVKYLPEIYKQQLEYINASSINRLEEVYAGTNDAIAIIEMKFVKVLADIELAGFPIDVNKLSERQKTLITEIKKYEKPFIKNNVNPNSPAQLLKFLEAEYPDVDILATDKATLAKFAKYDKVKTLIELKKRLKEEQMINDYINKWQKNGRIYSSFNQMRAVTGRMSASNPNAQQIPRAIKDMIYLGTKKRPVLKADYSNIEARTMAVIAKDPILINLFKDNKDMHVITAAAVTHKKESDVTKEERTRAKPVNFGFMYGMGPKAFVEYALTNYGIVYTLEESETLRNIFLNKYYGIKAFHNNNSNALNNYQSIIKYTILGRAMRLDRFTDANNYPVQGSAADMIKLAAVIIYDKIKKQKIDANIINIIHDEIILESSAKDLAKAKKILKESMESAADYVLELFHTPVEVEVIK